MIVVKGCLTCYYYTTPASKPPCNECWHQNKRVRSDKWRCWLEKRGEMKK